MLEPLVAAAVLIRVIDATYSRPIFGGASRPLLVLLYWFWCWGRSVKVVKQRFPIYFAVSQGVKPQFPNIYYAVRQGINRGLLYSGVSYTNSTHAAVEGAPKF